MSAPDYDAIIIGGGASGMTAAVRMQLDLGRTNVLIIEREPDFGGTWEVNRYLGAGCDVPPRLYSFSFAQKKTWSEFFAKQAELSDYFRSVARKFKLYDKAALCHEGRSAKWNSQKAWWEVEYQSIVKDAQTGQLPPPIKKTAKVLISGMGGLSIPRDVEIDGVENFKGKIFHSAKWDESVDFTDKNVVVIGNGCSATQAVPLIAKKAKRVTQIAKAKHWVSPQIKAPFPQSFSNTMSNLFPLWPSIERYILAKSIDSTFLQADRKYGEGARQRYADVCARYIREYAPPEYEKMLLPTTEEIPVACKRRVFDDYKNGYIPSLNLPHVSLTNKRAVKITENAVVLDDGTEAPADIIVAAIGFKTGNFTLQMDIQGPNGSLEDYWRSTKGPQAYRATFVSAFPNMGILWGPNSITGHYSAIWTIESCAELITAVFRPIFAPEASPTAFVKVSKAAEEKEQRYIHDEMQKKVYTGGCGAWYVSKETGRVTALAPCTQFKWQTRCRYPVLSEFDYSGIKGSPQSYQPLRKRLGMLLGWGDVRDPSVPASIYEKVVTRRLHHLKMLLWAFLQRFLLDPGLQFNWPPFPQNRSSKAIKSE